MHRTSKASLLNVRNSTVTTATTGDICHLGATPAYSPVPATISKSMLSICSRVSLAASEPQSTTTPPSCAETTPPSPNKDTPPNQPQRVDYRRCSHGSSMTCILVWKLNYYISPFNMLYIEELNFYKLKKKKKSEYIIF